jgi:hypothetical protein
MGNSKAKIDKKVLKALCDKTHCISFSSLILPLKSVKKKLQDCMEIIIKLENLKRMMVSLTKVNLKKLLV